MLVRSTLAVVLLTAAVPAAACSIADPNFRVATSLQLAARADTIVLARVVRQIGSLDMRGGDLPTILLKPAALLKGSTLPASLTMKGYLDQPAAGRRPPLRATRSDPLELREPNPDALSGACVRYLYSPGTTLLLFLEREQGKLRVARHVFARSTEDVPSPQARWVKAVREYAQIAALPPAKWKAALTTRRKALVARGDPDSRAIAADMQWHLGTDLKRYSRQSVSD